MITRNKLLGLLGALIVTCSSYGISLAWYDIDLGPIDRYVFIEEGDAHKGRFNIKKDGFDPSSMVVDWAEVSFAFSDDERGDGPEKVTISLDGDKLWKREEVDGKFWRGTFDILSSGLTGDFLGSLQDGILKYRIALKRGDAYFEEGRLLAFGSYKSVADTGATFSLFGLGLLALGVAKRRFAKK